MEQGTIRFIELNMNFPEYQAEKLEEMDRLELAKRRSARCVLETKTVEALRKSVRWLRDYWEQEPSAKMG